MKLTREDERLRRQSPAYEPDADWERLEPQAMNVVLSVRFDAPTARHIHALASERGLTPGRLIRDWTRERLELMRDEPSAVASVHEPAAPYITEDRYEELRQRYRPDRVDILLLGESRPAGGTFFYLANSNLYYATHAAFQLAFGPIPEGEAFLQALRDRSVWLYDLANAPVDRMRGRPRRDAVEARVSDVVELLRETSPRLVIAIKKTLGATVRQALTSADMGMDRLRVLPFPLYQWRSDYVQGLAAALREGLEVPSSSRDRSG
jgi:hypothetical protein